MGDMAMGKLRLNSEADILKGGASGPAIVAGKSADSLLVKRLLGSTDAPRMPMGGAPLSDVQIKLIRAWVDQGKFDTIEGSGQRRYCDAGEELDAVRGRSASYSRRALLLLPRFELAAKRSAAGFFGSHSQRQRFRQSSRSRTQPK